MSDLHLCDAEEVNPKRPLWKAYKQRRFYFDQDVAKLLTHVHKAGGGPCELVLNGDIFDFDSVVRVPAEGQPVDWLARLRGLESEEWMSVFKLNAILADHPIFMEALAAWVRAGHRLVFVIGNHDAELHWPKAQQAVRDVLRLGPDEESRVVFCNWFYLSEGDTYLSHGQQYDPYCSVINPIDPLIGVRGRPQVRVPFGDLAARYMINGMGYFNPHATQNVIMSGMAYARFFFKYVIRTQPLLLWTRFWGAMTTLIVSVPQFWRPAMSDPMRVEEKVQDIADRARATPAMVRRLRALDADSALSDPLKIMRELWLDRGLLFLAMLYVAFQVILAVNIVWPVSPWWTIVPLALLSPFFLFYHFRIRSAVFASPLLTAENAALIHKITGATRVVFGHTHEPEVRQIGPVEYVNCGCWSPAFSEPECKTRLGTQTFVWIRPDGAGRQAELLEWPPGGSAPRLPA